MSESWQEESISQNQTFVCLLVCESSESADLQFVEHCFILIPYLIMSRFAPQCICEARYTAIRT